MALAVPQQWTAAAADQDAEIFTYPATDDWVIAVVSCRVVDGGAPLLNLGDVSRNLWRLLATDTAWAHSEHTAAQLQIEVWACPRVHFDGWQFLAVYASAMQISAADVGSLNVHLSEVSGFANGSIMVDKIVVGTASAATSLSLVIPAPGANCMMVAGAAVDSVTATVSVTSPGWTSLTGVDSSSAPNLRMAEMWRASNASQTASWSSSVAANWVGIAVSIRETAVSPYLPSQPNPAWPATQFQVGLGYDLSTPLSRVRFTDQTTRYFGLAGDRGIQAELGVAQQGQTDIQIRDDDGAYTPRTPGSATASAVGSATTIKVPDAQATNIHKSDFFRLYSSGVLKELNIFQVTGTSSSGGTTTVTFARADGTAGGAQAATAGGDVYTGIKIDLYIPYRLLKTIAGKTHVAASGWLRDLQITYMDAHWAEVQAEGTDALETLQAASPSALRGEILRRNPTQYWPLDDASGSGYAQNASGFSTSTLTQTASKYGTGANATADFGASTQDVQTDSNLITSLAGDPGAGWLQNGQTSAELTQKGQALVGSDPLMPSIAGGVTIVGATLTTNDQSTVIVNASVDPTIFILRNTDPGSGAALGSVIKMALDRVTLTPKITVWDKATHATTTTTGSPFQTAGGAWSTWALTFNQTSWAVYTGGQADGSGSCNLVDSFSAIDVGGEADQFFHGHFMPGLFAHIAIFPRRLTVGEIARINSALIDGRASELSSTRIQRKLNSVTWRGPRIVNSTPVGLSAEPAPTGSVADTVSEIAGYEDSLIFVDAAGQLQFRNRILAYQQQPRAVLGENTSAGEIPYQPGMTPSFNPTVLYNSVKVDNTHDTGFGTVGTTTFVAVDDVSGTRYNPRTLPRSARYFNDISGRDMAWWWLAKYAYPQLRVETVTIEASAAPDRWPFVLSVEVGDLLTLMKRQIGAPPYAVSCRVISVKPAFTRNAGGQTTGSVTLTLAAAPQPVTVLNDSVLGIVGNTTMGA